MRSFDLIIIRAIAALTMLSVAITITLAAIYMNDARIAFAFAIVPFCGHALVGINPEKLKLYEENKH